MRTMLRWTKGQRSLIGDKLGDAANLAGGILVFGQLVTQDGWTWRMAASMVAGLALWFWIGWLAFWLTGEEEP